MESSETNMLPDTEPEVVMLSPEVGLDDQVIQIIVGPKKGTHTGGLDGKTHAETAQVVKEVFVDGAID